METASIQAGVAAPLVPASMDIAQWSNALLTLAYLPGLFCGWICRLMKVAYAHLKPRLQISKDSNSYDLCETMCKQCLVVVVPFFPSATPYF